MFEPHARYLLEAFQSWSSGDRCGKFVCYAGADHPRDPARQNVQPVIAFDLERLRFSLFNLPPTTHSASEEKDVRGMFPDGSYYMPHTYDGLKFLPPEWGGAAPNGELLQFFMAGGRHPNRVIAISLNDPRALPRVFCPQISWNGNKPEGQYPTVAPDAKREGYWVSGLYSGPQAICFVDKKGNVGNATRTNNRTTFWERNPDADVLVGFHDFTLDKPSLSVCNCSSPPDGTPEARLIVDNPHDHPLPFGAGRDRADLAKLGFRWSAILKCFVGYEGQGKQHIWKVVPSPDPLGTYTLISERLQSADGSNPMDHGGTQGTWGKFLEIPEWRSFIWIDRHDRKPQVFRLTGM